MRRTTMVLVAAALAVAGSCGGGGGGRSLADLAQGTWTCAYRTTPTANSPSGAGLEARVTAKITATSDTRGSFQLKLAAGSQDVALDGNWRLSGRDLRVAITHDSFLPEGSDLGPPLAYRGVAPGAHRIEVKGGPSEPFKPVAVSRHGGTYEFRWEPFEETRARLTCHR